MRSAKRARWVPDPGLLFGRRLGQIDQLLVGSQVAFPNQSGCRDHEVGGAEQLIMQGVLPRGELCGRGRR